MDITVSCVQLTSRLGAVAANLAAIRSETQHAVEEFRADLVVFPECAVTGYPFGADAARVAEPVDGAVMGEAARIAAELNVHLAVGYVERAGDELFDSLAFYADDGTLLTSYRKVHLFSSERDIYAAGDTPSVVDTRFGRIGLTICYDLIFPEYVRRLVDDGAELVVNGTNWMTDPWQASQGWDGSSVRALARIRALENGVPVAMACLAGSDGDVASLGWSTIAGSAGNVLGGVEAGNGVAVGRIVANDDTRRWAELATYRADRRPDVYTRSTHDHQ